MIAFDNWPAKTLGDIIDFNENKDRRLLPRMLKWQ